MKHVTTDGGYSAHHSDDRDSPVFSGVYLGHDQQRGPGAVHAKGEVALYQKIVDRLNHLGFSAWRENIGRCRGLWYGAPIGAPDILFIAPGGLLFGVEVKTKAGRLSPEQREYHRNMRRMGVPVVVVRSIKDVHNFVREVVYPKIHRVAL